MVTYQWQTWPENAILPDDWHNLDPDRPWQSPDPPLFPLPSLSEVDRGSLVVPEVRPWQVFPLFQRPSQSKREELLRRRPSKFSFQYWKACLGSKKLQSGITSAADTWPGLTKRRIITAAEWKAYGHWARPIVSDYAVKNATPPPAPRNLTRAEQDNMIRSIESTNEETLKNWVGRTHHPSICPRPPLWLTPPTSPQASTRLPPSELQLNAFLEHRVLGKPPILLDIRANERFISAGELPPGSDGEFGGYAPFQPDGPNGAQCCTYPGVQALHINALADDTLAEFPWPFTVLPHHPSLYVTLKDFINAIQANFNELLTLDEVESIHPVRREQMFAAYWIRVKGTMPAIDDDGVRRVDYLGDRYMFRGLEPNPDGKGFILFLGPE